MSLDLASFELVRNSAAALQGLLAEGLVDVVLANEEEAQAFSCVASGDEAPAGSVAAAAHAGGSCGSTLDEQPQCSEDSRDETAQTAVEALAVPAASKPFVDSAAADGVPMAASNGVSASDGGGAACGGDYAAGSAPAARSPGSPAGEDLGFFGPAAPPGVQQAQDLLLRHCRVTTKPWRTYPTSDVTVADQRCPEMTFWGAISVCEKICAAIEGNMCSS